MGWTLWNAGGRQVRWFHPGSMGIFRVTSLGPRLAVKTLGESARVELSKDLGALQGFKMDIDMINVFIVKQARR